MGALERMKRVIMRDKPRLAICIYHKREDILVHIYSDAGIQIVFKASFTDGI